MSLPIAETFWSIQGEGCFTGTPMLFVRLAGCNVGRYAGSEDLDPFYVRQGDLQLFQDKKHSVCETADGQRFLCDTDYHKSEKGSLLEVIEALGHPVHHVCITGGEPLLHLEELLAESGKVWEKFGEDMLFHLETSGTKPLEPLVMPAPVRWWITCSPKVGYLFENWQYISEFKILCGPNLDLEFVKKILVRPGRVDPNNPIDMDTQEETNAPVFIQPIQGVQESDQEGFARCMKILEQEPSWRLSAQLHKFLHLR